MAVSRQRKMKSPQPLAEAILVLVERHCQQLTGNSSKNARKTSALDVFSPACYHRMVGPSGRSGTLAESRHRSVFATLRSRAESRLVYFAVLRASVHFAWGFDP